MVQTSETGKGEARRLQILAAAAEEFRERGFHATGMRDIAERLGMTAGALYYYFESKEQLLEFCQQETLRRLLERADAAVAAEGPTDRRLRDLLVGHVEIVLGEAAGGAAHVQVSALGQEARTRVQASRDRYERRVRELIAAGVEAGALRCDPRFAARAVLGALNAAVTWYRAGGGMTPTELGCAYADLLLAGLRSREGDGEDMR